MRSASDRDRITAATSNAQLGRSSPLPGYVMDKDGYHTSAVNQDPGAAIEMEWPAMIRSFLLLIVIAASAQSAAAQTDCPPATDGGLRIVTRFVTNHWRNAATANIPVMAPSSVRLLTDATDAAVCRRLREQISTEVPHPTDPPSDWALTMYQAGSHYFAVRVYVWTPVPSADGRIPIRIRWQPLYIFDADLRLLASIAS